MSDRNDRACKIDFDYFLYHTQGVKVPKARKHPASKISCSKTSTNMSDNLEERKMQELQIFSDIQEVYDTHIVDEIESVEELSDVLEEITVLGKQYRHIHVELKYLMGENDYTTSNPYFSLRLDTLRKYVTSVKDKLKQLSSVAINSDKERLCSSLMTEENIFSERLKDFLAFKIDENSNVDEIRDNGFELKQLLETYYGLFSKSKIGLGDDFQKQFGTKFEDTIVEIKRKIQEGRAMLETIQSVVEAAAEKDRLEREAQAEKKYLSEQKFQANAMLSEITNRSSSLVKKCDSKSLQNLSDFQIFELQKELKSVDIEMREMFASVTAYSKVASLCGDEKDDMLRKAEKLRKTALDARNLYAMDLHKIATSLDVTEEKLKNISTLEINLEKFQGYDSKIDIYSFRADFEKLIQPKHQKRFWIDVLKKNYLTGPALTLVDKVEKIEDVWKKLIEAYGNVKLLLQTKMNGVDKLAGLDNIEGDEKIANVLAKIINIMTELSALAEKFHLENKLYIGGGLEKMFSVIGENRERRFLTKSIENSSSSSTSSLSSPNSGDSELEAEKATWERLKAFLQKELNVREALILNQKSKDCLGVKTVVRKQRPLSQNAYTDGAKIPCYICGETDHVVSTGRNGRTTVDYFSCPIFASLSCENRKKELRSKGFCWQCLLPGVRFSDPHTCFDKYMCPDPSHKKQVKGFHVLVCEKHNSSQANINLLEDYKVNVILKRSNNFKSFTKNIALHCHFTLTFSGPLQGKDKILPDIPHSTIFMFQTINIKGKRFRIFYDSGGTRTIIKQSAAEALMKLGLATLDSAGPGDLHGVGDTVIGCTNGIYTFYLPLRDGYMATFSGMCLNKVTATFPMYPLKEVENEVRELCQKQGGDALLEILPSLPESVGGDVDILIGLTYHKYFPKKVWEAPSGLFISDSQLLSEDGTTGIVGGPHPKFTEIEGAQHAGTMCFFSRLVESASSVRQTVPCDVPSTEFLEEKLGIRDSGEYSSEQELDGSTQIDQFDGRVHVVRKPPKCVRVFDEIESAGTEVSYRCANCRNCTECKKSLRIDVISIQEEIESQIIDRCVSVDVEKGVSVAKLPFVVNPDTRLKPNDRLARKVYDSQVRVLSKKPKDRESAIQFEGKLQELGFVDYLHNLSAEQQAMILDAPTHYLIPWFPVWNEGSVSTPCRLVFDATRATSEGCSLNSLLAKGVNNMNSLIGILIRWTIHKYAFHTDVAKMYNRVRLDESHWRFQLYYWEEQLRVDIEPVLKVIKTLIYGVRPSGQLAGVALQSIAEKTKDECPMAYPVITEDTYVDDCMSGNESLKSRNIATDQLVLALAKGGFSLKGFTFSGEAPPDHLSRDGISVSVGGMKWFSQEDLISLNIPDSNVDSDTVQRNREGKFGLSPKKFTRRYCVSKVAEIFDPLGRITPLTSGFKYDINQLTLRKLDWDDLIPEDLRRVWESNFELMQEIRNVRFQRATVPQDAVSTDVETICVADASSVMICAGVYVRFRRKCGKYSCQLLFGRSKVVPKNMSLPRAELLAASINAATAHVVTTSLGERHKKSWMLTDSQVALHWIHSTTLKLKMWVRNRVIEINRLVDQDLWRYVMSKWNIADLGTRKGAKLSCIGPDGEWTNGFEWMCGEESEFPLKTAAQVVLDNESKSEARKEEILVDVLSNCQYFVGHVHVPEKQVPDEVGLRYKFCNYVLDPNRFRFRKVVRVLALIFRFLKNFEIVKKRSPKFLEDSAHFNIPEIFSHHESNYLVTTGTNSKGLQCQQGLVVELPDIFIKNALAYYFIKSTLEIKHFLSKQKYCNISKDIGGILYYTGRILPDQNVTNHLSLAEASFDLSEKTFCVPMIDRMSPVAYALTNEIHWYDFDVRHGGIESVLRQIQTIAYLIGGRNLVKVMKRSCIRCRILRKKRLEVIMGPKDEGNLCIAPAFHTTQVDICGPFDFYSHVKKRAKAKCYFVVFCCSATGAVDIKIMADYTTDAFVFAFIRFSTRYGFPCSLLPDPGSQLIKGCKDMVLSFSDIQHQLSVEHGVSFRTCPVGAHFVHGKVERKIQTIKRSIEKHLNHEELSIIQWETLGSQIANSINNLPLGLGNKVADLENLDLLTPNRLLLGRNNSRSPTAPLVLSNDVRQMVQKNCDIFGAWFRSWLTSYVPSLMDAPKWFRNDRNLAEGDVVLFSKSEKEFENIYQYGIIKSVVHSKDGRIRKVEVEYVNHTEKARRCTTRHARDLIVIHPVEELGLSKELFDLVHTSE